ncbi:unnamed protein product [Sphagnum balticum]
MSTESSKNVFSTNSSKNVFHQLLPSLPSSPLSCLCLCFLQRRHLPISSLSLSLGIHHTDSRFYSISAELRQLCCTISHSRTLQIKSKTEKKKQGVDGFQRAKLAVFLSGGGSNFRALHAATLQNAIYGDVVVVVSDRPGCKGCEYAQEHKIPILSYPKNKYAQDGISASQLVDSLRHSGVDYILLAGYLKMLPTELVQVFPRAILNIHPALLPSFGGKGFYGMKVHEAVIRSGARYSGATVHFVDEEYDSGPILAQRVVPVLAYDSPLDLAARVLKQEHILYTEAVAALCEDRIFWREDGVPLIRKSWDEAEYL